MQLSWNKKILDYEIETNNIAMIGRLRYARLSVEIRRFSITRLKHAGNVARYLSTKAERVVEIRRFSITRLKQLEAVWTETIQRIKLK